MNGVFNDACEDTYEFFVVVVCTVIPSILFDGIFFRFII